VSAASTDLSSLLGARVLVPRGGAWGERVATAIAAHGAHAVVAPAITFRPPRDRATRDRAFADLAAGTYAWLFVTSAAAVEQLVQEGVQVSASTRVAAVGHATARAATEAGLTVAFVPEGPASASAMIRQWCAAHAPHDSGRCLVVRSDLAMAVVSDELDLRGYDVDVCIGYRTVGCDLPPDVIADLRSGAIDVVLTTSTSVVREIDQQVGPLPATTLVGSIGTATTAEAHRRGMTVAVTAPEQTIDALLAALAAHRAAHRPTGMTP
jgi:uroporphyrinogen-III synthase